jgi:pimeloyl-ACP methyl ester carboxylesterase
VPDFGVGFDPGNPPCPPSSDIVAKTHTGLTFSDFVAQRRAPHKAACQTSAVASDKPPLVLLHPATSSGRIWRDMVPRLSEHHEVYTPTLVGHRGGPEPARRPVTDTDVIDSAERYLDEHGLDRPHIAGNSMGGLVAVELARRGRAGSVCAISPAGFWSVDDGSMDRVLKQIRQGMRGIRAIRRMAPRLIRTTIGRRILLHNLLTHPERVDPDDAVDLFLADALGCTAIDDLLKSRARVETLDPLPCPVTLAWAAVDRVLPVNPYGRTARERLPGAEWVDLPDTGHNAMIDDPDLVARTILKTTGKVAT